LPKRFFVALLIICGLDARQLLARGGVTAFVPHYAMSGGTLIALAANETVMCQQSILGPIDTAGCAPEKSPNDTVAVSQSARFEIGEPCGSDQPSAKLVRLFPTRSTSLMRLPVRGLHFDSTTAVLPPLTTINKRLIFLEREKSIGRLRTSRQRTAASR
jgi:hypothetical protein